MSARWIFCLLLIATAFNRGSAFMPEREYWDIFLFHDITDDKGNNIGISKQTTIWMLSIFLKFFFLIWIAKCRKRDDLLFNVVIIMESLSVLDWFLIYENAWFYPLGYPFQYTDFKAILYLIFTFQWNRLKLFFGY